MNDESDLDLAIVIGRFQPFHRGHLALLEHALACAPRALVIVGSAPGPRVAKNPFTGDERIEMMRASLSHDGRDRTSFACVRDYYDEVRWAAAVRRAASTHARGKVALVGFRKDESSFYLSLFPEWVDVSLPRQAPIDATNLRQIFYTSSLTEPLPSELRSAVPPAVLERLEPFRRGPDYARLREEFAAIQAGRAKYGTGPFVTLDAVVVQAGHVLLIQRKHAPGAGLWALPGGFLEGGERLLAGAIRELREETLVTYSDAELRDALRSVAVFDHPQRSQRGRTITHAHYFELAGQTPTSVTGSDDAQAARWFPIAELPSLVTQLFDDHYQILDYFLRFARD